MRVPSRIDVLGRFGKALGRADTGAILMDLRAAGRILTANTVCACEEPDCGQGNNRVTPAQPPTVKVPS